MHSETHPDDWLALARDAVLRADVAADNNSVHSDAYLAAAVAMLDGWESPAVASLLDRVHARRNPDGGYGLGVEFDAFGNGMVNPPDTSYVVTLTDHVGLVLLAAFDAGRQLGDELEAIARLVVGAPRTDVLQDGFCVAYSLHANDAAAGCVHNVNAGAGAFIAALLERGLEADGWRDFVDGIRAYEVAHYLRQERTWKYSSVASRRNDPNHAAYQAESMLLLEPSIGWEAVQQVIDGYPFASHWDGIVAVARLAPFFKGLPADLHHAYREFLAHPRHDRRSLARSAFFAVRTARAIEQPGHSPGTLHRPGSVPHRQPSATPSAVAGEDESPRPHVVMIVGNDVTPDTRVKKMAASASRIGLQVTVLGVTREPSRYETRMGAVRVIRLPMRDTYRLLMSPSDSSSESSGMSVAVLKQRYQHDAAMYWLERREVDAEIGRLKSALESAHSQARNDFLEGIRALDEEIKQEITAAKERRARRLRALASHRIARSRPRTLIRPVHGLIMKAADAYTTRRVDAARRRLDEAREHERLAFQRRKEQALDRYRNDVTQLQERLRRQREALDDLRGVYEAARATNDAQLGVNGAVHQDDAELPDVRWRDVLPTLHDIERVMGPEIDALNPDLVHAHDMHMIGVGERAAARRRRSGEHLPVVYDAHEYVRGLQRHMEAERLAGYLDLEKEYIRRVDRVITVSEPLARLLRRDYDLPQRPDVVLNAPIVPPRDAIERAPYRTIRERVELPDDIPLLVYSGRVHPSRGVATLVRSMAELDGVHLALVGEPSPQYRRELQALAEEAGCHDRLHIVGYVPPDQVVAHLTTATAGVNLLLPIANHALALPNKFFEYLHAELPIVNADVGVTSEIIQEYGLGEVFHPEDPHSLAIAARKVLGDPERYRDDIRSHPELVKTYAWSAQERVLVRVYRGLLGEEVVGDPPDSLVSIQETDPHLAPGGHDGAPRVAIGVTNMAGQAWEWMKALREAHPSVRTHVATITRDHTKLQFPTDVRISRDEWRSLEWQTRQVRRFTTGFSHVLLESGSGVFGTLGGGRFDADATILEANGVQVGLVFHGSDIRNPRVHRDLEPHSPFDPMDELTQTLQRRVDDINTRLVTFNGPIYVSTLDLLDYVPSAAWLPLVVDLHVWNGAAPPLAHGGLPRVVHLGTNSQLKGSPSTLRTARRLHDEGLIELVTPGQVPPDELPQFLRAIDVYIDGTRLGDYGVTACQALALNRIVIGNVAQRVRERVPSEVPIVQANPATLDAVLRDIAENATAYAAEASKGRAYIERFHDGRATVAALHDFLGLPPS